MTSVDAMELDQDLRVELLQSWSAWHTSRSTNRAVVACNLLWLVTPSPLFLLAATSSHPRNFRNCDGEDIAVDELLGDLVN
jgi:hypothetical protein